jgi:hypothetical protein
MAVEAVPGRIDARSGPGTEPSAAAPDREESAEEEEDDGLDDDDCLAEEAEEEADDARRQRETRAASCEGSITASTALTCAGSAMRRLLISSLEPLSSRPTGCCAMTSYTAAITLAPATAVPYPVPPTAVTLPRTRSAASALARAFGSTGCLARAGLYAACLLDSGAA